MTRLLWWSEAEEATLRFGRILGSALAAPAWIGLIGPLGAGKTRVVQGVASGLGFQGRVRSPTFVLEHRYRGRFPIRHLDLYRLETVGEELASSWEEEEEVGITLVEWAERVPDPPGDALWLRLDPRGDTGRWIDLEWPRRGAPLRDFRLEGLGGQR